MTISDLDIVLRSSWSVETAYWGDRKKWTEEHSSIGQCTVTALVVYDFLGGKIIRGYSNKYKIYHYWNEINGEKIDLTFDQFFGEMADIVFDKVIEKSKNDILKIKSVRTRYLLLKQRVNQILNNCDYKV